VANVLAGMVAVPAGWMLSLTWGMSLAMVTSLPFSAAGVSQVWNVLGGLVLTSAGLISYGALAALITGLTLRWVLAQPTPSTTEAALGLAAQS
jgi:hypothetical protein